ncbi:hypothetical protein BCV72DRAFT_254930 [Rhizopus microsporus var. microsporus]|uniref:Uncharacterized protein n=1 Tax=Rhizopus microsporus var. microsporus TaxID=86635 RepID=A0A1X0RAZ5_RHIZD|nr:hypothetical protein BCV72DRAFT_254930 [Rhizopus microsporus var. microsporus]
MANKPILLVTNNTHKVSSNFQQNASSTNTSEHDYDILAMTLPLRSGSVAFSEALLREQSIKDRVIRAARDLPLVVVEVQSKVNHSFIVRVIRYCLSVFDEAKSLLVLIVISAEGFSRKQFRNASFDISDNDPFFTHSCQSWTKQAQFYTTDSISKQTDVSLMDPIITLCYFFMLQEKNILTLEKYDDPAIQDQSETSTKRLRQYAEDVIRFAQQFKRQHLLTESEIVTPIASKNIDEPSANSLFVNNMKA